MSLTIGPSKTTSEAFFGIAWNYYYSLKHARILISFDCQMIKILSPRFHNLARFYSSTLTTL